MAENEITEAESAGAAFLAAALVRGSADTQRLYDDAVLRRIALVRYENDLMSRSSQPIRIMQGRVASIAADLPENPSVSAVDRATKEARRVITEGINEIEGMAEPELRELARIEAEREAAMTEAEIAGWSFLVAALLRQPYQGRTSAEWFRSLRTSVQGYTSQQMKLRFVEGRGPLWVAQYLRGSQGVGNFTVKGLGAVLRTLITGVWNFGREFVWTRNRRVDRVQWRSILDSRTSDICRTLDGQIFKVGEGQRPPAHVRCRSIVVPIRAGEDPPERETYAQWLRRQPEHVVVEVLGKTRAEAYLAGNLPMSAFTNDKGLRYSLDELRARYPGKI